MKPCLVLLAGPHGAGKSTLYQTRVAPRFAGPFINADIIQMDEFKNPSMEASYEAVKIASSRREEMQEERQSFATETVFSHLSKLELTKSAQPRGYLVIVMHVGVDSPNLSVARVKRAAWKKVGMMCRKKKSGSDTNAVNLSSGKQFCTPIAAWFLKTLRSTLRRNKCSSSRKDDWFSQRLFSPSGSLGAMLQIS